MSSMMRKSVDTVNRKVGADETAVLELVHQVMHAFRSQQYRALDDPEHGITHMEAKVLGFFARRPGATQRELAEHSGRDKAQIARLIKGLRERGLLDGEPDAEDRRNLRLQLTEAGRAIQRMLQHGGRKLEARALAGFSEAERRQLAAMLARLQANLEGE